MYFKTDRTGKDGRLKKTIRISRHDLWSVDYTLAQIILPTLVAFKEKKPAGHPFGITYRQWMKILDSMIWSFGECASDYKNEPTTTRKIQLYYKKVQGGLDLFSKYYMNLWD